MKLLITALVLASSVAFARDHESKETKAPLAGCVEIGGSTKGDESVAGTIQCPKGYKASPSEKAGHSKQN